MRQSPCVDNFLSFDPTASWTYANHYGTSPQADVTYLIGTGTQTFNPKYSTTFDTTSCPLVATVSILDTVANQWNDVTSSLPVWLSSFSPATGTNIAGYFTIYQADTGFVAEKTYNLKIKVWDVLSMKPAIETFFDVYVYHKCSRNTFTISD